MHVLGHGSAGLCSASDYLEPAWRVRHSCVSFPSVMVDTSDLLSLQQQHKMAEIAEIATEQQGRQRRQGQQGEHGFDLTNQITAGRPSTTD